MIIWHDNVIADLLNKIQKQNVVRALDILCDNIKSEAPVRTGNLRDSVEARKSESMVIALAPYASFVEFGTWKMEANPFFQRGVWKSIPEIRECLHERV